MRLKATSWGMIYYIFIILVVSSGSAQSAYPRSDSLDISFPINQFARFSLPEKNMQLSYNNISATDSDDTPQIVLPDKENNETNQINSKMLYRNTAVMVWAGVGTMGLLYLMPSSFTNWDDEDDRNPLSKWWYNVSHGPVWDKDDFFLNYVTHPYAGAIYYMGARSAGASPAYSFLYSFALSTFFWEYGLEAFAEKPSIQDLIVTPVIGSLLGEGFHLAKQHIVENDSRIYGSRILGKTALFLMDPITEVTNLLFDESQEPAQNYTLSSHPFMSRHGHLGYTLTFQLPF